MTNSLTGGGAERAINLLVNALNEMDLNVNLLTINDSSQDLVELKVKVHKIGRKRHSTLRMEFQYLLKFFLTVRALKPKFIVLNCNLPEVYGALLPASTKLVVVEHANPSWHHRRILGFLTRMILFVRRAKWVRVSEHINVSFLPFVKSSVIKNPFIFESEAVFFHGIHPVKRLVFVGRLESFQKRPEVLLDFGKALNLPVLYIGEGADESKLMSLARAAQLNVSFTGYVRNPWKLIKEGDLLVVPSRFEGDGLVVVEAIYLKIPLLVSDIPDFRRFNLNDINYFLNVNSKAKQISEMQLKPNDFIATENVRTSIINERSIEIVTADWIKLLNR